MLKGDESLFKNEVALDFSYQPKLIPYREQEQKFVASCIKPLFSGRNGRNVFIHGKPGIGKTVACKHILREIEEETDEIIPAYINCWQKNTTYKIMIELCGILDYKFTMNRRTEELFKVVKQLLNRKNVVFIFDEVDKLEDQDFLYMLSEEIFRKSIILITNYKEFLTDLDERIRSRLMLDSLEFKPYNSSEVSGILKQRLEYAFWPNVWTSEALERVVKTSMEKEDMREGLHIMREATNMAEGKASKQVLLEHVEGVLLKLSKVSTKEVAELTGDESDILKLVNGNSGKKIGELYSLYTTQGGTCVYKSFQRKVDRLEKNNFISIEKIKGGGEGNTTIVKKNQVKLTDFNG
tara:strand:- start:1703 stop:2758 length:1056 start_codon:yes stop_codon:yes gene_type:complete